MINLLYSAIYSLFGEFVILHSFFRASFSLLKPQVANEEIKEEICSLRTFLLAF